MQGAVGVGRSPPSPRPQAGRGVGCSPAAAAQSPGLLGQPRVCFSPRELAPRGPYLLPQGAKAQATRGARDPDIHSQDRERAVKGARWGRGEGARGSGEFPKPQTENRNGT